MKGIPGHLVMHGAGADIGFCVGGGGGHIGMGMGACPSRLARVSGKAQ